MLEYIYIFAWVVCIASQVLFDLSSKREKGLWTLVGPNSPPVSTKGHTQDGFCGGGAPGYGGMFGYNEGAPGNPGAVGGSSLFGGGVWDVSVHGGEGVPSLSCLYLTPFV